MTKFSPKIFRINISLFNIRDVDLTNLSSVVVMYILCPPVLPLIDLIVQHEKCPMMSLQGVI